MPWWTDSSFEPIVGIESTRSKLGSCGTGDSPDEDERGADSDVRAPKLGLTNVVEAESGLGAVFEKYGSTLVSKCIAGGAASREGKAVSRGNGGKGASGGIGKYKIGGERTCENVAEK